MNNFENPTVWLAALALAFGCGSERLNPTPPTTPPPSATVEPDPPEAEPPPSPILVGDPAVQLSVCLKNAETQAAHCGEVVEAKPATRVQVQVNAPAGFELSSVVFPVTDTPSKTLGFLKRADAQSFTLGFRPAHTDELKDMDANDAAKAGSGEIYQLEFCAFGKAQFNCKTTHLCFSDASASVQEPSADCLSALGVPGDQRASVKSAAARFGPYLTASDNYFRAYVDYDKMHPGGAVHTIISRNFLVRDIQEAKVQEAYPWEHPVQLDFPGNLYVYGRANVPGTFTYYSFTRTFGFSLEDQTLKRDEDRLKIFRHFYDSKPFTTVAAHTKKWYGLVVPLNDPRKPNVNFETTFTNVFPQGTLRFDTAFEDFYKIAHAQVMVQGPVGPPAPSLTPELHPGSYLFFSGYMPKVVWREKIPDIFNPPFKAQQLQGGIRIDCDQETAEMQLTNDAIGPDVRSTTDGRQDLMSIPNASDTQNLYRPEDYLRIFDLAEGGVADVLKMQSICAYAYLKAKHQTQTIPFQSYQGEVDIRWKFPNCWDGGCVVSCIPERNLGSPVQVPSADIDLVFPKNFPPSDPKINACVLQAFMDQLLKFWGPEFLVHYGDGCYLRAALLQSIPGLSVYTAFLVPKHIRDHLDHKPGYPFHFHAVTVVQTVEGPIILDPLLPEGALTPSQWLQRWQNDNRMPLDPSGHNLFTAPLGITNISQMYNRLPMSSDSHDWFGHAQAFDQFYANLDRTNVFGNAGLLQGQDGAAVNQAQIERYEQGGPFLWGKPYPQAVQTSAANAPPVVPKTAPQPRAKHQATGSGVCVYLSSAPVASGQHSLKIANAVRVFSIPSPLAASAPVKAACGAAKPITFSYEQNLESGELLITAASPM